MSKRTTTKYEEENLLEKGRDSSADITLDEFDPDRPGRVRTPPTSKSAASRFSFGGLSARIYRWIIIVLVILGVMSLFTRQDVRDMSSERLRKILSSSEPQNAQLNWVGVDKLFLFGDSYSSNLMEDLQTEPPRKVMKLALEDGYYKHQPNWVNFLTEAHNSKPYDVYNFAMGGSTVDDELVKPYLAGSSLVAEVNEFMDHYNWADINRNWHPDDSLFIFWFGVNDILLYNTRPPLEEILESYQRSVDRVYDNGARNFLFLTVPAVDQSRHLAPSLDTPEKVQSKLDVIADISMFNARLYDLRDRFRRDHPDASATIFDTHRFFTRVVGNPGNFEQTKELTHAMEVCKEVRPRPPYTTYWNETCTNGALVRQHSWTDMHATYPMHDALAARVKEDCLGSEGWKFYCA